MTQQEGWPQDGLLAPVSAPVLSLEEAEALDFLRPLSADYPDFERWYRARVVPGLRSGSRRLIRLVRHDLIVGVGIAKSDDHEKKICTVRVADAYAGRGLGLKIFDDLLLWLDCDHPHLTVSEEKYPLFERIFERYGFRVTSIAEDLYRKRCREILFNEADVSAFSVKHRQPLSMPIRVSQNCFHSVV